MTNEQIIKALECCKNDDCDNCPNTFGNCYANLAGYTLGLIKKQQAEIKWLKDALQTQTDIIESGASSNEPVFELDIIKAAAIKEFAGKLIEVGTEDGAYGYVGVLEIERTAKEMVGADNGSKENVR